MARARTRGAGASTASWPKRALLLFLVILLAVFGLVFLTGNKSPSPKLGIDLQGGTRVTLVPQGDKPSQDQLEQARRIMEDRVNGMGVSGAEVVTAGNSLVITVPGDDAGNARTLGKTSQLLFRPVIQPQQPTPEFPKKLEELANRWVTAGAISAKDADAQLAKVVPALKQSGFENAPKEIKVSAKEPEKAKNSVEEQKRRDASVDAMRGDRQSADPNVQNAAAAMMTCKGNDPLAGADDPSKPLVACSPQGPQVLGPAPVLEGQNEKDPHAKRLTGEMIDTNSQVTGGLDPNSAQMAITFKFLTGKDHPGGETWSKFGQEMMGQQVAITLDSQVISAPKIQNPTPPGETTQITGDFSEKEAQDLANNLRYGALPLSFVGENGEQGGTTTTISPTLGAASLKAGLIAGLVGLVLVALYALWYYRGLGVVAIVSLIASFGLVYGALVLLGRWIGYSLDLAGIAGLIIGIGTTADSFVVYFEKIKDEILQGSTFRSAVPRAWKRAKSTIITGNFVTLIAAVILYFLAIGDVKGFAFTLGLTTLSDVIIAFLVSAPLVILLSRKPFFAKPGVNGLHTAFRGAQRRRLAPADANDMNTAAKDTPLTDDEQKGQADSDQHAVKVRKTGEER